MFFLWKDEYSIGIEALDLQHRFLINMINDIYISMQENRSSEVTDVLLARLQDYINDHFAAEKRMMEDADYSGCCEHLQMHDEFVAKVAEMRLKHSRGQFGVLSTAVVYLRDWLNNHICKTDKEMAQALDK